VISGYFVNFASLRALPEFVPAMPAVDGCESDTRHRSQFITAGMVGTIGRLADPLDPSGPIGSRSRRCWSEVRDIQRGGKDVFAKPASWCVPAQAYSLPLDLPERLHDPAFNLPSTRVG